MQPEQVPLKLPTWLPQSVARYVAHTEHGLSIRELARRDGCHASTVSRQIHKLEAMRDDPCGCGVEDVPAEIASKGDGRAFVGKVPRICQMKPWCRKKGSVCCGAL
ncbi:hypothetical protein AAFF_G00191940 [Aldrovandia affinis]|uniref:Uncharacterized protein n=1 Tax=Aldrovandia affinis TaxID=143900 RepID=A0AAD7VWZ2_9TELE|nr:hypothetical protein AAFF_G00191940 [Aldrovandia affinis]